MNARIDFGLVSLAKRLDQADQATRALAHIDFNTWRLAARMEHADRCTRRLARMGVGSDKRGSLQLLDVIDRDAEAKDAEGPAGTVLRAQSADGRVLALALAVQVAREVAHQLVDQHFPGTTPEPTPCP